MVKRKATKIRFEKVSEVPWVYSGTSREISPEVAKMEEHLGKMRKGEVYKLDIRKLNPEMSDEELYQEVRLTKTRLYNTGRRITRAKGWKFRCMIRKEEVYVQRMENNWTRVISRYERN